MLTGGRYKFGPLSGKYKLIVNRDGVYRLSPSWISTNAPALAGYNPAAWRLDCLGQQVPMTVVDANADGTFNGSDYAEFYGQALAWDILSPDEWNGGDFTDDNVYWLYADSGSRAQDPRAGFGAPVSGYPMPADFQETVHHEVNNRFQPLVPHDGVDHWYQDPPLRAPASGLSCRPRPTP